MSRDVGLALADIVEQCDLVIAFTAGLDEAAFVRDRKTRHAVAYALLAIGEAAKHVPADVRARTPDLDWRRIAGMRDVLAHGYFAVDAETVWSVVTHRIPELRTRAERLLAELGDPDATA